jgi:DHA1 family bicyclomycin/chloramphenicol resistance-like MFS transporter
VQRPSLALLALISAGGPLALNIIVPSLPGIATALGVSYSAVQLLLTVYLLAFGGFQLIVGPLADRIGRRAALQLGLLVLIVSSAGGLFASSIEVLTLVRIGQAFGACTLMLVPRAIVRDSYPGAEAVRAMAFIAMVMSVGPALSPVIGGVGEELVSWRFGFGFCVGLSIVLLVWLSFALVETRVIEPEGHPNARELLRRYASLLSNKAFLGNTLVLSMMTGCFFAWVSAAPALFAFRYAFSPGEFGGVMVTISFGFVIGTFAAARAARFVNMERMMVFGAWAVAASMVLLISAAWVDNPYYYVAVMLSYSISNGFVYPTSISGATAVDPRIAGAASAFMGFIQLIVGTLASAIAGAFAGASPLSLIAVCIVCGLLTPVCLVLIPSAKD